jgi:hypothetical protein
MIASLEIISAGLGFGCLGFALGIVYTWNKINGEDHE